MSEDKHLFDTFLLVLGGLVGLALIVLVVAQWLSSSDNDAMSQDEAAVARLQERIRPVGQVSVAGGDATPTATPSSDATEESANADTPTEVAERSGAEEPAAEESSAISAVNGQEIYNQACVVCHGAGIAGAPKLGDNANWAPRIAQGVDTMYGHAIKGFQGSAGMMPPKGGRTDLSDDAIKAAVDYMAENSQ